METDVCIIGGGVAGLTLAASLVKAGRSVTLLESGDKDDAPAKVDLSAGENVGRPYEQLTAGRYRRLGGCSHLWNIELGAGEQGPRLQPLRPSDFEERPWLAESGWPFGSECLDPYYRNAYRQLGLGDAADDPREWSDEEHPLLPLDPATVETTLFRFMPRQVFSEKLPRQLAASPGVRLIVDATVIELVSRAGSRDLQFARVAVERGHEFTVTARTFVLAAGAIENTRLMLASRSQHPSGLGNDYDLVGRYFMEHPHFCAGWLIPGDRRLLKRLAYYRVHRNRGQAVMAKLRLSEAVMQRERLLGYCVGLRPIWRAVAGEGVRSLLEIRDAIGSGRPLSELPSMLRNIGHDLPGIARYGRDRLTQRLGRTFSANVVKLNAMTEQSPNPDSRVTLAVDRDALGQQRVRLDWRLSDHDLRSIERSTEILGDELRRSGLGKLVPNRHAEREIAGGWHHMGTTRMHRDPRRGVVDENCRVHGSSNLYVAGPSVFPAAGYANPILTVVALSLRLAAHLNERSPVSLSSSRV